MKPFGNRNLNYMQRIFNYRLSRARRVIENVFGIITRKFQVFERRILLEPPKAKSITLAACVLHNFLIDHKSPGYLEIIDSDSADNEIQDDIQNHSDDENANENRNKLMEWFLTPGAGEVHFQYESIA